MHALTIAQGWGPSASRVSTIALARPRRPAAALVGCGEVPEEAGVRSTAAAGPGPVPGPSRAGRGPVAGPARRGGGRRGRVLAHSARAGTARGLPIPLSRGPRRLRAAGGCGGKWGSEARPKLPFPDFAGPHLLQSGDEHSFDSGDV